MNRLQTILSVLLLALSVKAGAKVRVTVSSFGHLSSGQEAHLFRMVNAKGAAMTLTDYGARIVGIEVPDRKGRLADVVVGYGKLADFETGDRFMGCTIGRYANRIDSASFTLAGRRYQVNANEVLDGVPVSCHGGTHGFDRFLWHAEVQQRGDTAAVIFSRLSQDGEEGFPGNLSCSVTFCWTESNACIIEYEATTDAPTVVNLSNHTYFNMRGGNDEYVMNQLLTVYADSCILNNRQFCPQSLLPVEGSPFDFRQPHRVDYRIDQPNRQLEVMHGMSACWKLRTGSADKRIPRKAAVLYDGKTGRGMETWTTEPFLLTYTGRLFDGSAVGKQGPITKFSAMLMETIHAPNSPNLSWVPTTTLLPGQHFHSVTEYRFFTR